MNLALPFRLLLWPFSLVYGAAARLQAWLYAQGVYRAKRLNTPVVSVGNLTVGGTGKTPMVLWLAERFQAEGKRVGILSRGYRGSAGTSDEVEMLKGRLGDGVVFGVGPDRYAEGRRIELEQQVDVFLLDDGFQHLQLARAVDIVLLDSTTCLSKEWLLPAGRMREPLSALRRASAVVLTRVRGDSPGAAEIQESADLPTFFAETKLLGYRIVSESGPVEPVGDGLPPQPVFAFCGIGNPGAFFSDVQNWRMTVVGRKAFPDHHSYSQHDVKVLEDEAQRAGAKALVTTEKDIQNLVGRQFSRLPLYSCMIGLEVRDDGELGGLLKRKLATHAGFLA